MLFLKMIRKSLGFAGLLGLAMVGPQALAQDTQPDPSQAQAPAQPKALAQPQDSVPTMNLQHLDNYQNQFVTVLYALGSKPALSTNESQITISQIKASMTTKIMSPQMTIPSLSIPRQGFQEGYNYVIFVIHSQPQYTWVNPDGSAPGITDGSSVDETTTPSNDIVTLTIHQINMMALSQGHAAWLAVRF